MELIILYTLIFIMGTVFGSFCTLAIYRIPQKKNITNERSFCPNCKHKLGFFDLIPVFSYIFLGGKCRYCHKKISNSYFIIEFLMGLTSIGLYMSLHATWETMSILTLIEYLYLMIFVTTLVLIAGIDKNNKKICKPIIFFGCLVGFVHIIYLYIIKNVTIISIYKYVIYFVIVCVLAIITTKHRYFKYSYLLEIMMICIYINMFVIAEVFLITAVLTMISLLLGIVIRRRKNKIDKSDILAEKNVNMDLPIGFCLCISNILAMLIQGIEIIKL